MNFPSDWTILLARPIELRCGLVLRRLDDCVEYIELLPVEWTAVKLIAACVRTQRG